MGTPSVAVAATVALVVPAALALGAATRERNRDYWSETVLWQQTLAAQPDNARARLAYGVALMSAGQFADAEGQLQAVVDGDGSNGFAHGRLGAAQAAQGKVDSAVAHLERAVALQPADVDAHRWLGQAYLMRGSEALALEHLERALAVQPDDVGLLVETGRILADSRDPAARNPSRAIVVAERAAALTSRSDPRILDVLAVAQAGVGRFADAAATAAEALRLARLSGNEPIISELEYRVAAYQSMAASR